VTLDIHATNRSATRLAADLRRSAPPVISYPSQKILKLDLRTVFPEQDETLTKCLSEVLRNQE